LVVEIVERKWSALSLCCMRISSKGLVKIFVVKDSEVLTLLIFFRILIETFIITFRKNYQELTQN
jgi:hypothetical protein